MLRIENVSDDNYYVRKQEIELILVYREVGDAELKGITSQRDSLEFLK